MKLVPGTPNDSPFTIAAKAGLKRLAKCLEKAVGMGLDAAREDGDRDDRDNPQSGSAGLQSRPIHLPGR
ncbi:hypothetical protein EMEDMD4_210034 [Sinorhizobium medicae]|uniref:Uncharacterized protein n=1 Tax=Sinorhizobium medicae TaxID=110321 RepID=A0A508WYT3_9HYPH|nr:hypothetical protein EMEDMD4_210034 [Sinorhizobium medicae]